MRRRIDRAYPGHGVLGEEFGRHPGDGETRWIIDPIDATHNYLRGIPVFATLVALERAGEVLLGVISAPAMGRRWHASRGGGAWQGSRRLHVSSISVLQDAQIFHSSRSAFRDAGRLAGYDDLVASAWRERAFGDFWGYGLVAEGAGEAMIDPEVYPWDLAAPLVLVEEAGGRFTDLTGRRTFESGSALATNGVLHEPILSKLNR